MNTRRIVYQSVPKFVQGPGVLNEIGEHTALLSGGKPACVLMDPAVKFLQNPIEKSLNKREVSFSFVEFDGNLNMKHVVRLGEEITKKMNPSVYIGVGSGKTIDLSKMLARLANTKNLVVATASATDAAASHAAVGVDDLGHVKAVNYDVSPDIVLVDSEVIVKAPVRLFVAGIGDAISKKIELRTAVDLGEQNFFSGTRPFFVDTMAETLQDILLTKGKAAKESVEAGELNDDVEQVITSCVLLSTLVWENGGLAGAHSVANVLYNSGYCRNSLHGEQVAFGLLLFLTLSKKAAELERLILFYEQIGLPRCLSALGKHLVDQKKVWEVADGIHQRWKTHNIRFSIQEITKAIEDLEECS